MKIRYLGTGAAEGIPAVFCECSICKNARIEKGKEIRTRSQAIIDDNILVDFGPDAYWHSIKYNIEYSKINHLIMTHEHGDHLLSHDIICRKKNRFLEPKERECLTIYGGSGVYEALNVIDEVRVTKDGSVVFNKVEAYKKINIYTYEIIPLPAVHNSKEPFVYSIVCDGRSILYCHDSDILLDETLQFLSKQEIVFDLVSMDCTEGKKNIDYQGHMNFERNIIMKNKLLECGLANENTRFVVSHFSHNGLVTHKEAEEIGKLLGLTVAYDGMEVDLKL